MTPKTDSSEQLLRDGFVIARGHVDIQDIESLRQEANEVAKAQGEVCVRRLVDRSEIFRGLAESATLKCLLPRSYRLVRSILFDKTAEKNWPVAWHQDVTIAVEREVAADGYGPWSIKDGGVHVHPPVELLQKMLTLRVHLDATPAVNGALRVIPGSHHFGKLDADGLARMKEQSVFVCECSPGDVLIMHPLLMHSSGKSTEPARRRVLHFEYADRAALHPKLLWGEG